MKSLVLTKSWNHDIMILCSSKATALPWATGVVRLSLVKSCNLNWDHNHQELNQKGNLLNNLTSSSLSYTRIEEFTVQELPNFPVNWKEDKSKLVASFPWIFLLNFIGRRSKPLLWQKLNLTHTTVIIEWRNSKGISRIFKERERDLFFKRCFPYERHIGIEDINKWW